MYSKFPVVRNRRLGPRLLVVLVGFQGRQRHESAATEAAKYCQETSDLLPRILVLIRLASFKGSWFLAVDVLKAGFLPVLMPHGLIAINHYSTCKDGYVLAVYKYWDDPPLSSEWFHDSEGCFIPRIYCFNCADGNCAPGHCKVCCDRTLLGVEALPRIRIGA